MRGSVAKKLRKAAQERTVDLPLRRYERNGYGTIRLATCTRKLYKLMKQGKVAHA